MHESFTRTDLKHRVVRELVAADEWVRCVMGCGIGWMAIACPGGDSGFGQISKDPGWLVQVLGGSRTGTGLGSGEELVHDLGAGGDDGP